MNKKRLIWSFALILLLSLPIAHAQILGLGGQNIFFVLINAAVVFVVLFILQSFLIPRKTDKEITSVWVIIGIISLVVAWLYGHSGYIWNVPPFAYLFNLKLLVNTIIIAAILYFIGGLLKINLGSTEGRTGYGILIFLVSAVIGFNLSPDRYLWQQENIRALVGFLFGPEGILSPKGGMKSPLVVFISSFVLLSFFFNNWLLKGDANRKLNYALALIFAINLASPPVAPIKAVIQLGEIIFLLILADSLKATTKDKTWLAWLIAILLVAWASAALTVNQAEYRGLLGKVGCWVVDCKDAAAQIAPGKGILDKIVGVGKGIFWFIIGLIALIVVLFMFGGAKGKKVAGWSAGIIIILLLLVFGGIIGFNVIFIIGLLLLLPLLLIGGGIWAITRGEKRESKIWKVFKKYGGTPLLRWMRKSSNPLIKWIMSKWLGKDPYLDDELPFVFKDLMTELMVLMNYQTRLHTYFGKAGSVEEARKRSLGIEAPFEGSPKTYESRRHSVDDYRFGGAQNINLSYGWSNNRQLIALFFSKLKDQLEEDLTKVQPRYDEVLHNKYDGEFGAKLSKIGGSYGQFITNVKRIGLIHRLRSLKTHILDLVAVYGVYKHYYRFANENALFELWDYKVVEEKSENPVWEATPTNRDMSWENERNAHHERVKKQIFEEIFKEKTEKLREKLKNELMQELQSTAEQIAVDEYKKLSAKSTQKVSQEGYVNKRLQELLNNPENLRKIETKVESMINNSRNEIEEEAREELEEESTIKEIIKNIPSDYVLGFVAAIPEGNLRHEVDIKGFVLQDIHAIEIDHTKPSNKWKKIRRVKIEDIEDFPGDGRELSTWSWVYAKIYQEWKNFNEDLRFGVYHPFSRTYSDYHQIIDKRSLDFENVGKTTPSKEDQQYTAFDLEALKFSGKWVYWGIRNYWDTAPELKNPFPTLSTLGLSKFIIDIVKLRAKDNEIADKYLRYWVWDTGKEAEKWTDLPGEEKKS